MSDDMGEKPLGSNGIDIDLPCIRASNIEFIYKDAQDDYNITAEKVLLHGEYIFLTAGWKDDLRRETRSLRRIRNTPFLTSLRVPEIHYLVELDGGVSFGAHLTILDRKHDLNAAKATDIKTSLGDQKK
jgi:hypothetical protein